MVAYKILDWDSAYENGGNIAGAKEFIGSLAETAAQFRSNSDCDLDITSEAGRYDVFKPSGMPKGIFVFVHGGYWQSTDKSMWSHLAKGAVEAGWVAVLPGYDLCPAVGIGDIISMVASSINHAANSFDGPIVLSGHSAGGHLVAAMCSEDTLLEPNVAHRIQHVMPISGLGDLRPLLNTKLNNALKLDYETASSLSPVLKRPIADTRLTAWVGAGERAEFLRQNRMLADMWRGLGAETQVVEEPDKHHFSIVEGLMDPNSPLLKTLLKMD